MSDAPLHKEGGHVARRHDVNSEALLSFLITGVELAFGFFVLLKGPKSEPHRLFFAFVACLALWGFADAGLRLPQTDSAAAWIHKLGGVGLCLFPAVFVHFVSSYTGHSRLFNRPVSYAYGGAIALALFHTTGFVTALTSTPEGGHSVEHAEGYLTFVLLASYCCVVSAGFMIRRYRNSPSVSDQRTMMLISLALILVAGTTLAVDTMIPLGGFRPFLTGGIVSLVIVAMFALIMFRWRFAIPPAEVVAERVLNVTGDLVCVVDRDGYLSFATEVFRKALFLDAKEPLGRIHLREIVEEADRVLEIASNGMETAASLEVHFKTRTGLLLPVALSVSHVFDNARPTGVVLIAHDLSERRALARKFEESQEKYQNIVESSLDGIVVIQDGALVFVNASAIRIFGYENAEEMRHVSFDDTVAPGSKPFLLGDYRNMKIGDDLFRNYEMKGLTKAGKIIDLEINAKIVRWNEKMAVLASFRDITERKDLERGQAQWFWEQESLRAIDKQLTSSFDIEGVLDTVSRNARSFSRADFSGVILIQDSKMYRWHGIKGNRSVPDGRFHPMRESHRSLFLSSGPRVVHSFGSDPDYPPAEFPILMSEGVVTLALFPFGIKENLEGVLAVGFRVNRDLSEREHRLLSSLADKAAIAIANAELYEDLLERERELELLADARMKAEEAERRRIAREIHDGLGQMLSAIKFNVEVLEDAAGLQETDLKKLGDVKHLLDDVMTEAREISHNLMPSVLEDFGLKPALQLLCESFGKRLEIPVSFQVHGVEARLDSVLEVNLYRIAQEALNNISKHAGASSVSVQLQQDADGIRLTIEDEGRGFAPPRPRERAEKGGMGLINMKHRASTFGGSLTVESRPGGGTTIMVQIPHVKEQKP